MTADRYAAVPADLRALRQWVCWQRVPDPKHPEKPRKVLVQPRAPFANASSTDPGTWGSFDEACNAAGPQLAGIGFVFDSGYVGTDVDDCREPETGALTDEARQIIGLLDSYTEVSPSGTGVHVICRGRLPAGRRRRGSVEMYETGRYFTITGDVIPGAPATVEERQDAIEQVHTAFVAEREPVMATLMHCTPGQPAVIERVPLYGAGSDADGGLLARARAARNGDAFARLYEGTASGYGSASEADLALCNHLAFWTGGDAPRIDRLFRQSGLYRPKWDERRGETTYGAQTVAQAIRGLRPAGPNGSTPPREPIAAGPAAGNEPEDTPLPSAICALDAPPAEPVAWTVDGLVLAQEITLLVADGGVGKTTAALAIAGAVAGGALAFDYLDFTTVPAPVLFVSEEDPAGVLLNRLEALIAGHGWDRQAVLSQVHLLTLAGVRLTDLRWQVHLVSEARRVGAGLIVLDPLVELTDGDESSNTEQRPVIRFCRALIRATGAAVVVVHHAGKAVEGKRKLDRIRGASAWGAAARSIYFCDPHEDGMTVDCLKLSRAKVPPPFVLERHVTESDEQEGTWASATLRFKTAAAAGQDRAERWLLGQLEHAGDRLNTSELKALAKGSGISAADVSSALRQLNLSHRIDWEKGDRGAKRWGLREVAGQGRQRAQNEVAEVAERLPGKVAHTPVTLPTPLEGARSGNVHVIARQGEAPGCPLHPRVAPRQRTDGMWRCPECVPDSRWRAA